MDKYDVVVFDREYDSVSTNAIAGMFLGADLAGVSNLPIAIQATGGSLQLIAREVPTCKYFYVETNLVDTMKLVDTVDIRGVFDTMFPNIARMEFHNNVVVGCKMSPNSGRMCSVVASFDHNDIIRGIAGFFDAYNRLPQMFHVFQGGDTSTWSRHTLPVSIVKDVSSTHQWDLVAPARIRVKYSSLPTVDPVLLMCPPGSIGWKRVELFNAIRTQFALVMPPANVCGTNDKAATSVPHIECMSLTASDTDIYTAVMKVTK